MEALIGVIDEPAGQSQRSLSLTLDAAMETVADLTANEFAELSLSFILRYTKNGGVQNLESFKQYIELYVIPFIDLVSREMSSYQYLETKQCASIGLGGITLDHVFRANYTALFQRGYSMDELRSLLPSDSKDILDDSPVLMLCLNDQNKLQFAALDQETLMEKLREVHIPEKVTSTLATHFQNNALGGQPLLDKLTNLIPKFHQLQDLWQSTPLKSLSLTSLGIAIGYCNARRAISSWAGDLSIWIK